MEVGWSLSPTQAMMRPRIGGREIAMSKMERLREAIRRNHGKVLNHTELEEFIDEHYGIWARSYGWRAKIKKRLIKQGYLIDLGYDERAKGHPHYFMLVDPEQFMAEMEAI